MRSRWVPRKAGCARALAARQATRIGQFKIGRESSRGAHKHAGRTSACGERPGGATGGQLSPGLREGGGAVSRIRTVDLRITNAPLYQLS